MGRTLPKKPREGWGLLEGLGRRGETGRGEENSLEWERPGEAEGEGSGGFAPHSAPAVPFPGRGCAEGCQRARSDEILAGESPRSLPGGCSGSREAPAPKGRGGEEGRGGGSDPSPKQREQGGARASGGAKFISSRGEKTTKTRKERNLYPERARLLAGRAGRTGCAQPGDSLGVPERGDPAKGDTCQGSPPRAGEVLRAPPVPGAAPGGAGKVQGVGEGGSAGWTEQRAASAVNNPFDPARSGTPGVAVAVTVTAPVAPGGRRGSWAGPASSFPGTDAALSCPGPAEVWGFPKPREVGAGGQL